MNDTPRRHVISGCLCLLHAVLVFACDVLGAPWWINVLAVGIEAFVLVILARLVRAVLGSRWLQAIVLIAACLTCAARLPGLLSLMAGTDAARFLSVRCSLIVELLLAVAWGAAFFVEFDEGSARAKGLFRTYSLLRIAGLVLPFLIGNFAVLFHLAADAVLGALFLGRAPKVGE